MLAKDTTLRDLSWTLDVAEKFVCDTMVAMRKEIKARGDLRLRLGITGKGIAPNYRFESPDGLPLVAYNGADHRPWPDDAKFQDADIWGDSVWSYDDLASYRGEIAQRMKRR